MPNEKANISKNQLIYLILWQESKVKQKTEIIVS